MSTREIIRNNLDNALAYFYFAPGEQLHGASVEEIACDLMAYAEDCQQLTEAEMIPHITEWLSDNHAKIHQS